MKMSISAILHPYTVSKKLNNIKDLARLKVPFVRVHVHGYVYAYKDF